MDISHRCMAFSLQSLVLHVIKVFVNGDSSNFQSIGIIASIFWVVKLLLFFIILLFFPLFFPLYFIFCYQQQATATFCTMRFSCTHNWIELFLVKLKERKEKIKKCRIGGLKCGSFAYTEVEGKISTVQQHNCSCITNFSVAC